MQQTTLQARVKATAVVGYEVGVTGERNVRVAEGVTRDAQQEQRVARLHQVIQQQQQPLRQPPRSKLAPDESPTCPKPSGKMPGSSPLQGTGTQRI